MSTERSFAQQQNGTKTPLSRSERLAMQLLRADGWSVGVLGMAFLCDAQTVRDRTEPTLDDVPLYQAVQAVEADLQDGDDA
jgi:hypothetical protein